MNRLTIAIIKSLTIVMFCLTIMFKNVLTIAKNVKINYVNAVNFNSF